MSASGRHAVRHPQSQRYIVLKDQIDMFLGKQDTLSAFMVWTLLEGLSCLVVPTSQLISGNDKWLSWILISVPLGILGAVMVGASSILVQWVQDNFDKRTSQKKLWVMLSQALGWLGMVGVGLPLILVGLELVSLMFKTPG
jgi:hypothetical protein